MVSRWVVECWPSVLVASGQVLLSGMTFLSPASEPSENWVWARFDVAPAFLVQIIPAGSIVPTLRVGNYWFICAVCVAFSVTLNIIVLILAIPLSIRNLNERDERAPVAQSKYLWSPVLKSIVVLWARSKCQLAIPHSLPVPQLHFANNNNTIVIVILAESRYFLTLPPSPWFLRTKFRQFPVSVFLNYDAW